MAREVREKAHAPYSTFMVGAALIDADGNIYVGCNIENASYGLTVCAERHAVSSWLLSSSAAIDACVVVTNAKEPTPPCGACRQVLFEFSPDMEIISRTLDGKEATYTLRELLPHAFTKGDL